MSPPIAKFPPEFIVDKDDKSPSLDHKSFENLFDVLKDMRDLHCASNIDKVIYNELLVLKDIKVRLLIKISDVYFNTENVCDIIELTMVLIEGYKYLCDIPFTIYIKDNSIISDIPEDAPEELRKRYEYNLLEIGKMIETYTYIVNGNWYVQNDTWYSYEF